MRLLFDAGASLHGAPPGYGGAFPLYINRQPSTAPVVTAGGEQLHVYGVRTIYFTFKKTDNNTPKELGLTFRICDVTEAILSFSNLLSTGFCPCTLQPQRKHLQVGNDRIPIAHEGRSFYIYPEHLKCTGKIDVLHEHHIAKPLLVSPNYDGGVMRHTTGGNAYFWDIVQNYRNNTART